MLFKAKDYLLNVTNPVNKSYMYKSNNCAKDMVNSQIFTHKSYMCIQDKGNRFLKTMFGEALARTKKKRDEFFQKIVCYKYLHTYGIAVT